MRKKHLSLLLALILTLSLCLGTTPASAKSLKDLNKQIKQKQAELDKGQKKEKELFNDIVDLESQIQELREEIANGQAELEVLTADLEKAQKEVNRQNRDLNQRLRSMYKHGSIGFMDVLLNSGSFSEFLTNLDMVQKIFHSDEKVLLHLQKAHDTIAGKKQEVESLQAELSSAQATAEAEKEEVTAQKQKLAEENKETAEALDDLEDEMHALEAELAAKAAAGEISSSKSSHYEGGGFLWPTPGNTEITSEYGWRICPFHGREFHAALDIGANEGDPIVAAAPGKVIQAGWYGGFGISVIIDHGGGITTQYNHCSQVTVSVGQTVKAGETVALVGSTGFATGPHLDFRVYENGNVCNPRGYL